MAYAATGLQSLAFGGTLTAGTPAATIWHYITNDADTVVEANGYFDSTAMRAGDLVLATLDVDGTDEVKIYVVSVGTGDPDSNDVTIVAMLIA